MRVVHERCCGLDIHKKFVVACLLATGSDGTVEKQVRTYSTMTAALLALSDWLRAEGCGPVVMESTGSYWRPVFNLLEEQCEVVVVNAYHVKAVPGRKTDVQDAEWLADLLRHGLVRASCIPSPTQRHLRDLTRYRIHLARERARLTNRRQTVLEAANIKLAAVVTDVRGLSARAILQRLLEGETDARALAELARGKLRAKRDALAQAVVGRLEAHHVFPARASSSPTSRIWMRRLRAWTPSSPRAWTLSKKPLRGSKPSPASPGAPPRCSWRRSARTWRASPAPSTAPPGRGCAQAPPRVAADASVAGPAMAPLGCGARSPRSPMSPVGRRARTWRPSSAASRRAGAKGGR